MNEHDLIILVRKKRIKITPAIREKMKKLAEDTNNNNTSMESMNECINDIIGYNICDSCGALCCKTQNAEIHPSEISSLSKELRISQRKFRALYIADESAQVDRLKTPCPFLKNEKCSVYEKRPAVCRTYPFLLKNTSTFPCLRGILFENTMGAVHAYENPEKTSSDRNTLMSKMDKDKIYADMMIEYIDEVFSLSGSIESPITQQEFELFLNTLARNVRKMRERTDSNTN